MTIGKKFLERVLNEGQLNEAKKDVDGFRDDFDITSLPASHPAVANMPMPMARQVVQLYHLLGVSPETLEMRPKAVRTAAIEVADEMRTNRALRLAAQRLFAALASAKGFARKEEEVMEGKRALTPWQILGKIARKKGEVGFAVMDEDDMKELVNKAALDKLAEKIYGEFGFATLDEDEMKKLINNHPQHLRGEAKKMLDAQDKVEEALAEATASMAPEKDVQLMGGRIVKQIEQVLAGLKLPSSVLQRAMRRDSSALMDTAQLLTSGAPRSKFMMLASELGIDLAQPATKVQVEEDVQLDELVDPTGADAYADAVMTLVAELGVPDAAFARNARMTLAKQFRDERQQLNVGSMLALVKRFTAQLQAAKSRSAKPAAKPMGTEGTKGTM